MRANENSPFNLSIYSLLLMILLALALGIVSLFTGVYDIKNQADGLEMFFVTRVPRTLALMLSGSAMALSGLVMQMLTQNRFAEPSTTGTIEWAGLGLIAVYALVPSPTIMERMTGAILFAFLGTGIFFLFLQRIRLRSSVIVPIAGMMMGAVISAISTFVGLETGMTQSLEMWFSGSFAFIERGRYEYLFLVVIATVLIYIYSDRLTIAGLGEDIANNLGLNYRKILLIGTSLVAIVCGVVAVVVGQLPFLGLIVPNVVSIIRGDNLRSNIPYVCLLGMTLITICDLISRTIIMPFEVPVSVILGTFGAPAFIFLLLRGRRKV